MPPSQKQSPREKMMDYLARRDHSEKELRTKLAKFFEAGEINEALTEARERGWLLPPEELAVKAAETLHRKQKGILHIRRFLQQKGLPAVDRDSERELEKAKALVDRKFGTERPFPWDDDQKIARKIARFLVNRGFDEDTVRKVIYEGR